MHIQVSRLGFILIRRLPVILTVTSCRFVRFTVTGIVRKSHPCSLGTFVWRRRFRASVHRFIQDKYNIARLSVQTDMR